MVLCTRKKQMPQIELQTGFQVEWSRRWPIHSAGPLAANSYSCLLCTVTPTRTAEVNLFFRPNFMKINLAIGADPRYDLK